MLRGPAQNTGFSTVTSAEEAYNEMKRRYDVADYDTHDMFTKLDARLKHGTGVSEEFVSEVEDFAERCKSLHMQARKGKPGGVSSVPLACFGGLTPHSRGPCHAVHVSHER